MLLRITKALSGRSRRTPSEQLYKQKYRINRPAKLAGRLLLRLFGFIAYRIPNLSKVVNSKIVTLFTTIVMVFCLWIQMNAIYQSLNNLNFITDIAPKIISIAIMIFMVIALYQDG